MENMEQRINFEEIAANNFDAWNNALQTKNAEEVSKLYSETATFHPTLNDKFRNGKHEAEEYFEHFLLKNPFGTVTERRVQPLGDDSYIDSGMYDFEVGESDKREIAHARFTFVWKKENGQWKIAHHHSSLIPSK